MGFRAPSADEAITSFADYLGEQLPASLRYADAGMPPPEDVGELDDGAVERMRALILETLDDPARLAQWFGRVMTQPKYVDQLVPSERPTDPGAVVAALQEGEVLLRSPGSRFAWRALDDERATLFADGDGAGCALPLARLIASDAPLDAEALALPGAAELLAALLDAGSLSWDEEG